MLGEVNHHQQLEKVFHQRKMKSDLADRKLYEVCPTPTVYILNDIVDI